MDDRSKYSQEGYDAFLDWIPKAFNPYCEDTESYDEWNYGWTDAWHESIEEEFYEV